MLIMANWKIKSKLRNCTGRLGNRTGIGLRFPTPVFHTRMDRRVQTSAWQTSNGKNLICFTSKYKPSRLFYRYLSSLFISVQVTSQQFLTCLFIFLLFSQLDAYVYRHQGTTQSHIYKRLMGRQRREVQRELLTTLGLSHRPHTPRNVEISSAPLYMLGLYKSASQFRVHDNRSYMVSGDRETLRRTQRQNVDELDYEEYDLPYDITTDLNRQIEDSGILSNEIGYVISNTSTGSFINPDSSFPLPPEEERRLLEESDVVVSYINTRQQQGAYL